MGSKITCFSDSLVNVFSSAENERFFSFIHSVHKKMSNRNFRISGNRKLEGNLIRDIFVL